MTGNARDEAPFRGTARPHSWVMRSLSPWISRMVSGAASRAASPATPHARYIGAQASQQAAWISRRADRIQRAAAWNGDIGSVSPALVDRFSQRVANRVQRSTRAHQVDSFAGGDNLDSSLDMPLVTNEGQITPLSEGGSDETPFEFGAFSPEHVQRKAAPQPAEAPAASPPMSNALRERAEQLRRSMADGTPAPPAVMPSPVASILQPSRASGASLPAAPRAAMQRAKPVSRVEEMGTGSAPKPAPPTPPTPEPPSAALQRKAQATSQRSASPTTPSAPSVPVPSVQRAVIPPSVVQGQGRLTQMLNARFKPKLDDARRPDAPGMPASASDDFSDSDPSISDAPAPRISRSVQPPAQGDTPGISEDLTPRAPIRRMPSPAKDGAPSVDVPVPTPKARVLRKPALPATTATPAAPSVQHKADERGSAAPPAISGAGVPGMPLSSSESLSSAGASSEQVANAPAVQRATDPSLTQAQPQSVPGPVVQRETSSEVADEASLPLIAPATGAAIQRETSSEVTGDNALPLVMPTAKEAPVMTDADAPASPRTTSVQRSERETPATASQPPLALKPAQPDAAQVIQRSTPAATTPASAENASPDAGQAPPEMVLRTLEPLAPAGQSPAAETPSSDSAAPARPAGANTVQRSIAPSATESSTAPESSTLTESSAPLTDTPVELTLRVPQAMPAIDQSAPDEGLQRSVEMAAESSSPARVSAPAQAPGKARVEAAETTLPTPAAPSDSAPGGNPAATTVIAAASVAGPAIQRMAVNPLLAPAADAPDLPVAGDVMPLVQRAPAEEVSESDAEASPVRAATPAASTSSASSMPSTSTPPALQRQAQAPLSPQASAETTPGATPEASGSSPVIQRSSVSPATLTDAPVDLTLRAPAAPSSQDPDAPPAQATQAAPAVQRAADTSAPASVTLPSQPTPQSERAQQAAVTGSHSAGEVFIQRSADAEMVLRAPAVSTPVLPVADAPAGQALSLDAAKPAVRDVNASPMPLVQRALAADANRGNGSPMRSALKLAQPMRALGTSDLPVLRTVTHAGSEHAPEVRTLAMPIVQRAAVKQQQQQASETRPANPFVAQQERAASMPVVQRAPAVSEVSEVQRSSDADALVGAIAKSEAGNDASPARSRPISDAELTRAAQRILPLIKRMLAVERERLFGR